MYPPLLKMLQQNKLVDEKSNGITGSLPATAVIRTLNSKEFLTVSPRVRHISNTYNILVCKPSLDKH
jgi:hypothetical protein